MKKLLLLSVLVVGTALPLSLPNLWPFLPAKLQPQLAYKKARIAIVKIADNVEMDESTNRLYMAAKDSTISGIVIVIDSSGGSAGEFSVVHDVIKKIATIKPIVALIKSRALSGGYLAASAADYIIAHSYSEVGNIGVIMRLERFKNPKVTDRVEADLTVEVFSDSEIKSIYDPFQQDLTDAQRDYLKSRIAVYSHHFRQTVANNRVLNMDEVKSWSDGKTFIGHEALELKLIDQIGTLFDLDKQFITLLKKRNPEVSYASTVEFV